MSEHPRLTPDDLTRIERHPSENTTALIAEVRASWDERDAISEQTMAEVMADWDEGTKQLNAHWEAEVERLTQERDEYRDKLTCADCIDCLGDMIATARAESAVERERAVRAETERDKAVDLAEGRKRASDNLRTLVNKLMPIAVECGKARWNEDADEWEVDALLAPTENPPPGGE